MASTINSWFFFRELSRHRPRSRSGPMGLTDNGVVSARHRLAQRGPLRRRTDLGVGNNAGPHGSPLLLAVSRRATVHLPVD
jgi:hypothetical protein